mmetsp:Transcript_40169/g.89126  ORF Transcript_40169/g.89126 Transcript_40169/m.89126 type:complete len:228 (-) Transcript_40169:241-924(-)
MAAALDSVLSSGDVIISLDESVKLRAHKCILEAASPVLRDVLSACEDDRSRKSVKCECGRVSTSDLLQLKVGGDDVEGWKLALEHLYSGVLHPHPRQYSLSDLYRVLPVAHKYDMHSLMEKCMSDFKRTSVALKSVVSGGPEETSVLQWLMLGEQLQLPAVKTRCMELMRSLAASRAWKVVVDSPELMETARRELGRLSPATCADVVLEIQKAHYHGVYSRAPNYLA